MPEMLVAELVSPASRSETRAQFPEWPGAADSSMPRTCKKSYNKKDLSQALGSQMFAVVPDIRPRC